MTTSNNKVFTKRVHVFKSGPQVSAQGIERNFTPEDLQEVVETYDPNTHEAPLVVGHSGDNDSVPSYGWIKKFVRKGDDLYADVNFTDIAKDLVKDGHYKKVSISFYSPTSPINPHKGKWSARHLALLGAAPPAVKGLEPFSFSEEEGVFEFATALSPDEVFDQDLGPTMLLERSPLEILKERLSEVRGEMDGALQDLEQSQEQQTETDATSEETTNAADQETAPENPNQQFSEMKKKLGREGAEASESAQQLANLETQLPEDKFEEGVTRNTTDGAHGQKVQVVQEVFEETLEAKAKTKADKKVEEEETEETEETDEEFAESKTKTKPETGDSSGREETGRGEEDSHAQRQVIGKGDEEERETKSSDGGDQEKDRENTAENPSQEKDRENTGKANEGDANGEDRWADAPMPIEPGVSKGGEPRGRDGGPTDLPEGSEESPDNLEHAVEVESVKGNAKSRVLHKQAGESRAEVKGGPIADHAEKADAHGRDGGPTDFPTKSEEEPDNLEHAVKVEDATNSSKVRILRHKSGDKPSVNHSEDKVKDPLTKTGKGSTYGQKASEIEEGEEGEFSETTDFCMGAKTEANPGFSQELFQELQALKAENDRLKREYEEQRISSRKEKIAQFVDSLYTEGKLTDGIIPQGELQSYCEGLELGTLEFAEGETPTTKLFNLLDRLPNLVYFGEVVAEGAYKAPEDEDLDPHAKALRMVANGEASDYVEAIKLCIPWGGQG